MANESELLINVVNGDKPNMLIGLNQKVRGRILFWLMRVHGHLRPPADRQGLTHSCYLSETR